tara:strand:+ start:322 stop:1266 length:945 start_codon:yes stop_codon:yes gene_type:complete
LARTQYPFSKENNLNLAMFKPFIITALVTLFTSPLFADAEAPIIQDTPPAPGSVPQAKVPKLTTEETALVDHEEAKQASDTASAKVVESTPPAPSSVPQATIASINTIEQVLIEKESQENAIIQGKVIEEDDNLYTVDDGTSTIRAKLPPGTSTFKPNQGEAIRLRGTITQQGSYGEKVIIIEELWSLSPKSKQPTMQTPQGPWDFSDQPIREVLTTSQVGTVTTVQGKIIFKESDSTFILQDKTGSIEVAVDPRSKNTPMLDIGSYVRVTGEVAQTDTFPKHKVINAISMVLRDGTPQKPSNKPTGTPYRPMP